MSKSYKKTPGWCDSSSFGKRQANKKVRNYKGDLSNGKGFKKLYFSKNEIIIENKRWNKAWALMGWKIKETPLYRYYMK